MTTKRKPIIWTISGSDCSGGAGIAADIKTAHCLGIEICHLITANTVQNSLALVSVNAVSVEILQQQADILFVDKPPTVIKIGLLANSAQVLWLTQLLAQLAQQNTALITVYDPVGQASVGGQLNVLSIKQLTPLLLHMDIITPNIMEAKALANIDAKVSTLAKKIQRDFAITSVIIKGGHGNNNAVSRDYCAHLLNQWPDKQDKQDNQDNTSLVINYQLSSARINSHYSHGGGCSFATALAAFLAQGYLLRDAFTLTKAFINQGLAATTKLSASQNHHYYGAFEQVSFPIDSRFFPDIVDDQHQHQHQQYQGLTAFKSLNINEEKLGLYPVIDSLCWLKRLLPLGLNIIQLRVKNLVGDALEQVIIEAIALAKEYDTRLFINDYWQLAIKHGAYGVHIGQEDLVNADLLQIQQAELRLGISTHGCYEFLFAQQLQPSYLAVGAIFATQTKNMSGQIQGIKNLTQLLALRPNNTAQQIPVVAIGGISLERAPQVLATGVDSIAVVTAITKAEYPELAVEKFKRMIKE